MTSDNTGGDEVVGADVPKLPPAAALSALHAATQRRAEARATATATADGTLAVRVERAAALADAWDSERRAWEALDIAALRDTPADVLVGLIIESRWAAVSHAANRERMWRDRAERIGRLGYLAPRRVAALAAADEPVALHADREHVDGLIGRAETSAPQPPVFTEHPDVEAYLADCKANGEAPEHDGAAT